VPQSSPSPPSKPSLLGISLRACNPAHALESVYHVLDVLEGSPAEVRESPRPMHSLQADAVDPPRWPDSCHGETLCSLGQVDPCTLKTNSTTSSKRMLTNPSVSLSTTRI
jgi:Tfp pilus assembly protein PilV